MVYRGKESLRKTIGTGGNHKCGAMKNALRKQSGASPQDRAQRNSGGAVRSPQLSAAAACLVLIVGVSFAMPGMVARVQRRRLSRAMKPLPVCIAAARRWGILSSGFWPFLLGVCVTVLCFRLRQMNREDASGRGKTRGGMELIENLLQLLTTFVGALLSGIAYRKSRTTGVFPAAVLLRLLRSRRRSIGRCICCCSIPRRASFMCRSSAGWRA